MCTVDLVEAPQKIFGSSINVVAARVVWEVLPQRRSSKLDLEKIDFVEEQDDARPHEPP